MIVSASYRTDIPAFYGPWFLNRLAAGYCCVTNPYNTRQRQTVSLAREDVDGFVFWTKNVVPFLRVLEEVHQAGFPFITQYTINGYPRALESRVVDAEQSVQSFKMIADLFGTSAAVWRYDTIVISSLTDATFHTENFAKLAARLAGSTDEVVVSFMQVYGKTKRNLNQAARDNGFIWEDPPAELKRHLLTELAEIAAAYSMKLTICTQPELMVPGVQEARCIDAERLMDVGDRPIKAKLKGMRKGCGCFQSKDIGAYDTCPHGCVYCYAVRQRSVALSRYQQHDPQGEFLFPQKEDSLPPLATDTTTSNQLPLL